MRCLWLTKQDPFPANNGQRIYSRGLLVSLAECGADVTLLSHNADESRAEPPPPGLPIRHRTVGGIPPRGIRSLWSRLPSDAYRLRSPELLKAFQQELREGGYDAVIIDQAALGWGAEAIPRLNNRPRPAIVYVSHNREALIRPQIARNCRDGLVMRLAMRYDAWKYVHLERRLSSAADLITAITPEDRQWYAEEWPQKRVIELLPGYAEPIATRRTTQLGPDTPRRVLLVGSFEWIAKRQNLEEFLLVANPIFQREGIEFQVVGRADASYVQQMRRRFSCVSFETNVPCIKPYLKRARLGLIAETVGGGFKLKILDYAFNFVPIAALKNALDGVDLRRNHDAIVEQSIPELVTSIVNRIDDFEFLNAAAQRTCTHLADRFRWQDRGQALYQALDSPGGQNSAQHRAPPRRAATIAGHHE